MDHFVPDPIILSLLTLQEDHVCTNIWNGEEVTFQTRVKFWQHLLAEPVLQVIHNTAFGNILDIGGIEINNFLIIALVER
ncbi:hypothetical protein Lal_00033816 [Lupinus albus]|nr:hypothetical protein Lal_00033816 [Lupinus albus]